MSAQRIKIPRAADRLVISAFRELMKQFGVDRINVSTLGFVQFGVTRAEDSEELGALLNQNSTLIDTVSFGVQGFSAIYYRGGNYPAEQKSPIFDELMLSENQNEPASISTKLQIVSYLTKKFKALEPGRVVSGISEEQTQLLAIHESTLERLESLNEELVRKGVAFREEVEKKFFEKVSEIEKQQAEHRAQLESEFNEKEESLKARESDLSEKMHRVDDRNNTHVRREIRNKMLDDVKERINKFGVSASTSKKRWPVAIALLLMALALGVILYWSGHEISQYNEIENNAAAVALRGGVGKSRSAAETGWIDASRVWLLWGRFALASFFFFGTVLYFIRWQGGWADRHASSEFQLQQFYLDVNRANWLIESCLEWRKETASPIPGVLLESVTRGLFQVSGQKEERGVNPADQLASALLGSASKLKLNVGGNEIEFNKPSKIGGSPKTKEPEID